MRAMVPASRRTSAADAPAPSASRRRWNTRPGTNKCGGGMIFFSPRAFFSSPGLSAVGRPSPNDAPNFDTSDLPELATEFATCIPALPAATAASTAAPAFSETLSLPSFSAVGCFFPNSFAAAAAANVAPFSAATSVRFCIFSSASPILSDALPTDSTANCSFGVSFANELLQSIACNRARRSSTFARDARDTTSSWSTTEVRNGTHDSAPSKSRHGGVANATHRRVGMLWCIIAVASAAVPAPKLCPNTVILGFFAEPSRSAICDFRTSPHSSTIHRAAAAIPRCALALASAPSDPSKRASASQSASVSASIKLAVPRTTKCTSPVSSFRETKYAGCWNLLSGLHTTTTWPKG
mmetsp:Transcript_11849/g.44073  ORF Transcript_11849/g.44073 Transcript_11849/m.44073 type:complete len:354 (+) Transcript_11849:766-1827(+)